MAEIVPSEELRAFVRRFYAAWRTQDLEALKEMFSTGAHTTVIGTDPDEWWYGATGGEMIAHQQSASRRLHANHQHRGNEARLPQVADGFTTVKMLGDTLNS